jgi:hypothetical protein
MDDDVMGVSEPTATNGPPPGLNGSGSPLAGFEALMALAGLLKDPEAVAALEKRQNSVAAAEARLAKRERQIESREADLAERVKAHLDEKKAATDKLRQGQAQLAYDRKEWAERCGDIEGQARRYRESLRVDIDMTNPAHMARLHAGDYARVGQIEEALAARRSPSDLAAKRAVAETPEPEFPTGTSISRSPPKRRG